MYIYILCGDNDKEKAFQTMIKQTDVVIKIIIIMHNWCSTVPQWLHSYIKVLFQTDKKKKLYSTN